jgi:hypothetical protein
MSERDDLKSRIAEKTGVQPTKVTEVVRLALEQLHRLSVVDEKGPTEAVMEACFSFGDAAAFHLIGLFVTEHAYHGRFDDAGIWDVPDGRKTTADIEESMLSPEILARVLLLPMHRTRQPNATSEDLLED